MKNLGVDVNIHINHRGLFNRFLSQIEQSEKSVDVLRTVDKLTKAGEEETLKSLTELAGEKNARLILEYIGAKGSFSEVLDRITKLAGGPCSESERLASLRQYMCAALNCNDDPFILDPSITRGLDYYTGVVFETFMKELPDIGSVCSGGRYDNLAGLYLKNDSISGVGTSIGLDRLITALECLALEKKGKLPAANVCKVAIACENIEQSGQCQALAQKLRQADIPCEVLTDEINLTKQYILAEKKGMRYVIIPGKNPLGDPVTLRDLASRQNSEFSVKEVIDKIKF